MASIHPMLLTLLIALTQGCARHTNPSFPLTDSAARSAIQEMRTQPKTLRRPLVLLGGFADVGVGTALMRHRLEPMLVHPDVLVITFVGCTSFEQCRQRVIEAVDKRYRTEDPKKTVEVDVVGQSMGGLVALYSSTDLEDGSRRLNAQRIFTLSSPLQGAKLAINAPWTLTTLHRDMRPNSPLYQRLAQAELKAELFSYTRLNDSIVGEEFAGLPGRGVWWVDAPPLQGSHIEGVMDDRVLADLARRLRGETPYTTDPPAPLPAQLARVSNDKGT